MGISLGRTGRSIIEHWEKDNLPSTMEEVEKLARELIRRKGIIEKTHLITFLTSTGYSNFGKFYDEFFPALSNDEPLSLTDIQYQDWGEAPDLSNFWGREREIQEIAQWIAVDNCRIVAFLGIGGIGKTMLARKVAEQVSIDFDYVVWISVREAPPLKIVLDELIRFLSQQQSENLSSDIEVCMADFIEYLRKYRCLLILDNLEALMQGGAHAGSFRAGYDMYGRLLQLIGESEHQSCLFLTSREKPKELTLWHAESSAVRCHTVLGLASNDLQTVLRDSLLVGSEKDWIEITQLYGGNPLALKVIAGTIRNLFDGKLKRFLAEGVTIFGDIRNILDEQFQRLTLLEQHIMYWLTVERQAIAIELLYGNLAISVSKSDLIEALGSLIHRSLIEKTSLGFTLQNVVMEYMTGRLVAKCIEEINNQSTEIFSNIALAKVTSRDYVRESQLRLIVSPVIHALLALWGAQQLEKIFLERLALLHQRYEQKPNYDAGNLLTLLAHLGANISGYDFSNLTIWEADLQNLSLENTNFSYATFNRCNFTQIFGMIIFVTFSPSSEYIAAGTNTGDILMWELKTRRLVFTFRGHTDWIRVLCFSENGLELFSSSDDQTIRMWNAKTGHPLKIFSGHVGRVMSLAIDTEKNIMVSGGEDKIIRVWDISSGNCIKELIGHEGWVFCLKFSPNKKFLLSTSGDTTLKLWTTDLYTCTRTLKGHRSSVWTAMFSRDGSYIASGGNDAIVRMWRTRDGSTIRTINTPEREIRCLAFNPQGDRLATAHSTSHFLRVWDVKTGQQTKVLIGHEGAVWAVAFSPKGDLLASGGHDHAVRLWNTQDLDSIFSYKGYTMAITSIAFSPVDSDILLSTYDDGTARLWDIKTGKNRHIIEKSVWKAVFDPTSKIIAGIFAYGLVHILDAQTGRILKSFKENAKSFGAIRFSPNGQMLITSGVVTSIWDINTNSLIASLPIGFEPYFCAFEPKKRWLIISGEYGLIQCWDIEQAKLIHTLEGHLSTVWSLSFNEKTQRLVSGSSDHTIVMWDMETMEKIAVMEGHNDQVKSVSFHPNGHLLASGGYDGKIRIWDAQTFECLYVLKGHDDVVWNVDFNMDGKMLSSGSRDGTIRIWDTTTFECMKILRPNRPYEKMNITKARGLSETQKDNLLLLGAVEDEYKIS